MQKFELIEHKGKLWAVPVKKKLWGLIKKLDYKNAHKIDACGYTKEK